MTTTVSFPIPSRLDLPAPVGGTQVMQDVMSAVEDVSRANTTVLLLGESGTGKEVFARYIDRFGADREGTGIRVPGA